VDSKNVYIILAVVLVAFAGFMGYRHYSKGQDQQAHSEDKYRRIIEMGKKSARVGLTEMAAALKKYHKANNSYPDSLDALYPKFVGSQAFINEIAWDYEPGENDFYLSKSVERGGKTLVASTDASLKTRSGTGATRVASAGGRKASGAASTGGAGDIGGFKVASGMELLRSLQIPDLAPEEIDETKIIDVVRIEPRIVVEDEAKSPSGLAAAVSDTYLVWRDSEGNLGIGNVQYPDADRFSVVTRDKWFNVTRKPAFDAETQTDKTKAQPASGEGGDILAMGAKSGYMTWKDKNGNIGFGNVQYPVSGDPVSIYVDGKWQSFNDTKPL